jgi:hypothetical protein
LNKTETRVINIVKADYYRASNLYVLEMLQELDSKYSWNHKEIKISEKGMALSLVTDMFEEIEPIIGDITKMGFSVINSETGGRPLKASFLIYRLKCMNGAVLPDKWGEARWTYDKRMTIENSLKRFRHKLEDMQIPTKFLEEKICGLLNEKLTDVDFRKIWRNLSRVVGPEEADYILEIGYDERKKILKTLKNREKQNRMCIDRDTKIEPLQLERNFYEIL